MMLANTLPTESTLCHQTPWCCTSEIFFPRTSVGTCYASGAYLQSASRSAWLIIALAHSEGRFRHSAVADGTRGIRRTSQSAYVTHDGIIRCIEGRALAIQGYDVPPSHLEPLQLVKYAPTEEYHFHTDWFTDSTYTMPTTGGNRVSSFFAYVYVRNDTTGGGTSFPLLNAPMDNRWCDIIDCDEPWDQGITFRPVEGNAIYWENLGLYNNAGNYKTLHAGLPLTGGEKVGLNIWTRQAPFSDEVRGQLMYPGQE